VERNPDPEFTLLQYIRDKREYTVLICALREMKQELVELPWTLSVAICMGYNKNNVNKWSK